MKLLCGKHLILKTVRKEMDIKEDLPNGFQIQQSNSFCIVCYFVNVHGSFC